MIATLDENHAIFQRDWVIAGDDKKSDSEPEEQVDNRDHFFSNVPEIKETKALQKKRMCRDIIDDSNSQKSRLEKFQK